MNRFSVAAEAIASSSGKKEKVQILATYFRGCAQEEAATSAVFFSARPFPAWEETTLQLGSAALMRVILELAGANEAALQKAYRRTGDLGAAACELFAFSSRPGGAESLRPVGPSGEFPSGPKPLHVTEVARCFREIAATRGPSAKAVLVRNLLQRAQPIEAKYLVKIITGELRIGLRESLVEEAIAAAYGAPLARVQRANMLLGDIAETLGLASEHRLDQTRMRMFHPLGFMLASPIDAAEGSFSNFSRALVEDKYDGIRAQAHCSGSQVRLFSRTLDDITESFPELLEPLSTFENVVLDGEVVAWNFARGQTLPFSELQKRLGRKSVTASVRRATPVAYVVFDILYAGGELLIDQTLEKRGMHLDRVFQAAAARRESQDGGAQGARVGPRNPQGVLAFDPAILQDQPFHPSNPAPGLLGTPDAGLASCSPVMRAPGVRVNSSGDLEALFRQAQARGNEGLMIKDLDSAYAPGRRGRSWLKVKRELATVDAVVTAVEWGHGKRIRVLSDYSFALRDPARPPQPEAFHALPAEGSPASPGLACGGGSPESRQTSFTPSGQRLLEIGKAYSGLTDREISAMTQWFLEHTIADHGSWREVEPRIVVEVAFNAVMRSNRHNSGFALRFPRILRLRQDKSPEEADTLSRLRQIYERQLLPRSA
jgi:DNA ligase-1